MQMISCDQIRTHTKMYHANLFMYTRSFTFSYRTFCLVGDGESAEGSVWEAANFASFYKLDNLVAIVDVNRLGQSDPTLLQHDMESYRKRWDAFGWNALVVDGHDVEALCRHFYEAEQVKGKPTVLICKTLKGKGIPGIVTQFFSPCSETHAIAHACVHTHAKPLAQAKNCLHQHHCVLCIGTCQTGTLLSQLTVTFSFYSCTLSCFIASESFDMLHHQETVFRMHKSGLLHAISNMYKQSLVQISVHM